jgi:hypothetical protein
MEDFDEIDLPPPLPKAFWLEKKLYLLATRKNYLGFWDPDDTSDNHETTNVWVEWQAVQHILKDLQDKGIVTHFVLDDAVKEFQFYISNSMIRYYAKPKTYEYYDLFLAKWQVVDVFNLAMEWWRWMY